MGRRAKIQTYAHRPSPTFVRRVWEVVSVDPRIGSLTIARRLGLKSACSVTVALRILRDFGYINYEDAACRARQVIIPFRNENTPLERIASDSKERNHFNEH